MNSEQYEQAKADLADMFRTPGWQTAKEMLRQRMRALEQRVLINIRMEQPELRGFQLEYALLKGFIERPMEFFMGGIEREDGQ